MLSILAMIAMAVYGIIFMVRGQITIGKKQVRGGMVYFIGVVLLLPFPLTFGTGFLLGMMAANEGRDPQAWLRENQVMLALVEIGIV